MKLEVYTVTGMDRYPGEGLAGRRKIKSTVRAVGINNVREVLDQALGVHALNAAEINYLWNYYKGLQDVRFKEKYVRENINEKVTVNRANEIVAFKSSLLLEEPIQYISHSRTDKSEENDEISKRVNRLNEMMRATGKETVDKSVVDWLHICGVGVKLAQRDPDETDAPFAIYSVDPRLAFVIYEDRVGEKPLAGVVLGVDGNGKRTADVFTENVHYLVSDEAVSVIAHTQYNAVPVVEYINNEARMGAFEPVISILNGINQLESNALDSVEDYVNGFDVFQNCDISDGDYQGLGIGGKAVKIKTVTPGMEAKVYRVASELSQSGVQTRVDDLTSAYLEICGMPQRNGGKSTSDTGAATIFRDGWATAVSRAKETETMFRQAERRFCRVVLNICKVQGVDVPELGDFECEFLVHKLSNIQSKTQVLCELLNNPYVHPKYAYQAAGVFDDNEEAYRAGMEWKAALDKETEDSMNEALDAERERLKKKAETK